MSHTVTITSVPDETSDDIGYEFGGTHDSRCEFYKPCRKEWHRHPTSEDICDEGEWSTKRAGLHAYVEGEWMVLADPEKDGCALRFAFEADPPEEVLYDLGLGETRDVSTEWDGECWSLVVHPESHDAGARS